MDVKKYDYSIIVLRIMATIFILICHIGTEIENGFIAQFFEVGVYIFLFLSGYLYGNKEIADCKKFLLKRYIRVTVPVLLYVLFCLILSLLFNDYINIFSLPLYIFNLQGYFHLFEFLPTIRLIDGTEHLWFITVIFVCYMITIALKKINHNYKKIVIILVMLILLILPIFGFRSDYIFIYFLGYIIKNRIETVSIKGLISSFIICSFFVITRLIFKRYCDQNGDNIAYTNLVIPFSSCSITLFIFIFVKWFVTKTHDKDLFKTIYNSKILKFFDDMSYPIYIGHFIFVTSRYSVFKYDMSLSAKILIFISLSMIISFLIYTFVYIINKFLSRVLIYE